MLEECGDIYCDPTIRKEEFGVRDAEKSNASIRGMTQKRSSSQIN